MRTRWLPGVLILLLAGTASAQTSFPMLTHVTPVAVQRGRTTEVTVAGRMNLASVYRVLVEGKGITAEVLGTSKEQTPATGRRRGPGGGTVKLKLAVAADAEPGPRDFRL